MFEENDCEDAPVEDFCITNEGNVTNMATQNAQSSARPAGAAHTLRLLLKVFAMGVTLFSFALLLVFIILQYRRSEVAKQTTFNIPFRYVLAGTPMLKRYSLRTVWYEGYLHLSYNTIWDSVSNFPPEALHISFERFSVSLEGSHLIFRRTSQSRKSNRLARILRS